jgi:hypothetical protein
VIHSIVLRCAIALVLLSYVLQSANGQDVSARVSALNGPRSVSPGAVYVVSGGRLEWVLNLLGAQQLNDSEGWLERQSNPRRLTATRNLGCADIRRQTSNCVCRSEVWIAPVDATTVSLGDPFECLEIVNRPLSNLLYNRNAESQIVQWRASLSNIIQRHRSTGERVVLCTAVESMNSGSFVTREGADPVDFSRLWASFGRGRGGESGVGGASLDPDMRVENGCLLLPIGRLVLSATFRELDLVEESSTPRILFKLGKTISRSIEN